MIYLSIDRDHDLEITVPKYPMCYMRQGNVKELLTAMGVLFDDEDNDMGIYRSDHFRLEIAGKELRIEYYMSGSRSAIYDYQWLISRSTVEDWFKSLALNIDRIRK